MELLLDGPIRLYYVHRGHNHNEGDEVKTQEKERYAMATKLAEHSKGFVFWAALADPAGSMPAFQSEESFSFPTMRTPAKSWCFATKKG